MTLVAPNHLVGAIWPKSTQRGAHLALLALAGTALLTLSAKLQIPFVPVPMTMQTFAVLVIGMAFGWRLAGLTVAAYLLEGALGLPVFAGTPQRGVGLAYMMGPTGGYLLGFLVSAMAVGRLADFGWDRTIARALAAMTLGTALIFAFGAGWMAWWIGVERALVVGVVPFLPGAAFKIALAGLALPLAWRLAGRRTP